MTPRQLALGADIATGLIVVSVAAAAGNLAWHIIMPQAEPHAVVTRNRRAAAASNEADLSPVVSLAPFGSSVASVAPGAPEGALELRGILLANPATLSTALIGGGDGAAKAYHVGDRMPDGSQLVAIAARSVVVNGASGDVRLGFSRGSRSTDGSAESAALDQEEIKPPASADAGPKPSAAATDNGELSGVAAIRALIPPSVAGISQPPAAPPPKADPH